jgi:hypothetical protein
MTHTKNLTLQFSRGHCFSNLDKTINFSCPKKILIFVSGGKIGLRGKDESFNLLYPVQREITVR